jgi:diguanylate cyclase (GGDEF)-like protein
MVTAERAGSGAGGQVSAIALERLQALEQENRKLRAAMDEMHAHAARLQMLADSDTLTPLVNRRRFISEVERALAGVRRYGTCTALMFADVDGLKAINDAHGHAAGDAALIHVAQLLVANVRSTDLVARIAGDEFGLLLDHLSEEAARTKLNALAAAIATAPLRIGSEAVALAVSFGMTPLRATDSVETVIARADAAMYEARRRRRSAV